MEGSDRLGALNTGGGGLPRPARVDYSAEARDRDDQSGSGGTLGSGKEGGSNSPNTTTGGSVYSSPSQTTQNGLLPWEITALGSELTFLVRGHVISGPEHLCLLGMANAAGGFLAFNGMGRVDLRLVFNALGVLQFQSRERLGKVWEVKKQLGAETVVWQGMQLQELAPISSEERERQIKADKTKAGSGGGGSTGRFSETQKRTSLNLQGNVQVSQQMASMRAEAFKCFELADGVCEAHYNRGVLLMEQGDWREAVIQLELAVKNNPQFCDALVNLGVALERDRKQSQAANSYASCLRINDRYCAAMFNFANALTSERKFGAAIQAYTRLIKRFGTPEQQDEMSYAAFLQPSVSVTASTSQLANGTGGSGSAAHNTSSTQLADSKAKTNSKSKVKSHEETRVSGNGNDDDGEGDPREDPVNAECDVTKLVIFAVSNRALCFHNKGQMELAHDGYSKALRMMPGLLFAKLNRAHVALFTGSCYEALADVSEVMRVRNSAYLEDFVNYCHRYQWALAVACKDLLTGLRIMPVLQHEDLTRLLRPPDIFHPLRLSDPTSREFALVSAVLMDLEAFGNSSAPDAAIGTALARALERALRCQLMNDYTNTQRALVAAAYLVPYKHTSSIDATRATDDTPETALLLGAPLHLYLLEVISHWKAVLALQQFRDHPDPSYRYVQAVTQIQMFLLPESEVIVGSSRPLVDDRHATSSLLECQQRLQHLFPTTENSKAQQRKDGLFGCYADLLTFMGALYLHTGSGSQRGAVECFDLALNLQPDNVYALYNRASAYHLTGRFQHTKKDYAALLEVLVRDENKPTPGQKQLRQVLHEYTNLLQKDPKPYWTRIPTLQGVLARAVEAVWKELQPPLGEEHTSAESHKQLANSCSAYVEHLLNNSGSPKKKLLSKTQRDESLANAERFEAVFQESLQNVEALFSARRPLPSRERARSRRTSRPTSASTSSSGKKLKHSKSAAGGSGTGSTSARLHRRKSSRGGDSLTGSELDLKDLKDLKEERHGQGGASDDTWRPLEPAAHAMMGQLDGVAGRLQNIREVQSQFTGLDADNGSFFRNYGRRLSQQREVQLRRQKQLWQRQLDEVHIANEMMLVLDDEKGGDIIDQHFDSMLGAPEKTEKITKPVRVHKSVLPVRSSLNKKALNAKTTNQTTNSRRSSKNLLHDRARAHVGSRERGSRRNSNSTRDMPRF